MTTATLDIDLHSPRDRVALRAFLDAMDRAEQPPLALVSGAPSAATLVVGDLASDPPAAAAASEPVKESLSPPGHELVDAASLADGQAPGSAAAAEPDEEPPAAGPVELPHEIPSEAEVSTPQGADAPGITGRRSAPAGAEGVGEDGADPSLSPADAAPEEAEGASAPEAAAGVSPAPVDRMGGATEAGQPDPEEPLAEGRTVARQEEAGLVVSPPRCDGSSGAAARPQQSSQAKPVPRPAGVTLPEPDWPALLARVDAGEKVTVVAESAGIPWKQLQGKRLAAAKARVVAAGEKSAQVPPPAARPAPASAESEPPGVDKPDAEGWSLRDDHKLILFTVMGKSDGHISGKLGFTPPVIRARRERLLADYGLDASGVLKRLNTIVSEADAARAAA